MTRFWMIRHAVVEENARARLYGANDVPLCPDSLQTDRPIFAALARRLPRPAHWVVTPVSRTRLTAEAIHGQGYPATPLDVEPDLIEQNLGKWQGLLHADLPQYLRLPAHPHWPMAGQERPPGGESMQDVIARVGVAMERLAMGVEDDVVVVSHGGTVRAAIAHAIGADAEAVLHLSIQNLSLSCLESRPEGWRVGGVNMNFRSDGTFGTDFKSLRKAVRCP